MSAARLNYKVYKPSNKSYTHASGLPFPGLQLEARMVDIFPEMQHPCMEYTISFPNRETMRCPSTTHDLWHLLSPKTNQHEPITAQPRVIMEDTFARLWPLTDLRLLFKGKGSFSWSVANSPADAAENIWFSLLFIYANPAARAACNLWYSLVCQVLLSCHFSFVSSWKSLPAPRYTNL
jgi:hypothetical protein